MFLWTIMQVFFICKMSLRGWNDLKFAYPIKPSLAYLAWENQAHVHKVHLISSLLFNILEIYRLHDQDIEIPYENLHKLYKFY